MHINRCDENDAIMVDSRLIDSLSEGKGTNCFSPIDLFSQVDSKLFTRTFTVADNIRIATGSAAIRVSLRFTIRCLSADRQIIHGTHLRTRIGAGR